MTNLAEFTIAGTPASDRGYDVDPGETPILQLSGLSQFVYRVTYRVKSSSNEVRATVGAPMLTLNNTQTTGQEVDALTPISPVSISAGIPGTRAPHLWEVECVVNGGLDEWGQADPDLRFSRFVAMRGTTGARKMLATERNEYDPLGLWSEAFNTLVTLLEGSLGEGILAPVEDDRIPYSLSSAVAWSTGVWLGADWIGVAAAVTDLPASGAIRLGITQDVKVRSPLGAAVVLLAPEASGDDVYLNVGSNDIYRSTYYSGSDCEFRIGGVQVLGLNSIGISAGLGLQFASDLYYLRDLGKVTGARTGNKAQLLYWQQTGQILTLGETTNVNNVTIAAAAQVWMTVGTATPFGASATEVYLRSGTTEIVRVDASGLKLGSGTTIKNSAGNPYSNTCDHVVRSLSDLPTPSGGFIDLTSGSWVFAAPLNLGASVLRVPSGATVLLRGMGWNTTISALYASSGTRVLEVDGTAVLETLYLYSDNDVTLELNNAGAECWLRDCIVENQDDGAVPVFLLLGTYFHMSGGKLIAAPVVHPDGIDVAGDFTDIYLEGVTGYGLSSLLHRTAGAQVAVSVLGCRVESNCTRAINWAAENIPTQGMSIVGNRWNIATAYTGVAPTTTGVNMKANHGNAGLLTETAIVT